MRARILPGSFKSKAVLVTACTVLALLLLLASAEARYVLFPIAATALIAIWFFVLLTERRGTIPVDDIGAATVSAIACYAAIPPLQFLLAGMAYTDQSALPLYASPPTAAELSSFTMWYVFYLLSFACGYLFFDQHRQGSGDVAAPPDRATLVLFVLLLLALSAFMTYAEVVYQFNPNGIYGERMGDAYQAFLGAPLLFKQLFGVAQYWLFIVKLGLLLTIFLKWKKAVSRYLLVGWVLVLIVSNVLWMGARTELMVFISAAAIFYHRFVTPLRLNTVLPLAAALFSVFILMGIMRGAGTLRGNVENLTASVGSSQNILAIDNEFQTLFAGNYELLRLKKAGSLGNVPLQFRLYDIIAVVPQQILPFQKLDVQDWVTAQSDNPGNFMFNPISQSIIGFGFAELVFRGLALGFIFAKVRAWYCAKSSRFWPSLAYFYLMTISFYTIRTTAIYIVVVYVFFRFVPLYLFCRLYTRKRVTSPRFRLGT